MDNAKSIIMIQAWVRGFKARQEAQMIKKDREKSYSSLTGYFKRAEIRETLSKSIIFLLSF